MRGERDAPLALLTRAGCPVDATQPEQISAVCCGVRRLTVARMS
jgi:hypothetical protein